MKNREIIVVGGGMVGSLTALLLAKQGFVIHIIEKYPVVKPDTDEKFDLRPIGSKNRCLSNHHHPKGGETIYAETCYKAHRVDTGYWVAY